MTLEISEYQKWILIRALYLLTTDEGLKKLQKDFPMMNIEVFGEETKALIKILSLWKEEKNESSK